MRTPPSAWDVSAVTDMSSVYYAATLCSENYDALPFGWSAQSLQSNATFHGGNSQYTVASCAARDILTSGFGWDIVDGGMAVWRYKCEKRAKNGVPRTSLYLIEASLIFLLINSSRKILRHQYGWHMVNNDLITAIDGASFFFTNID